MDGAETLPRLGVKDLHAALEFTRDALAVVGLHAFRHELVPKLRHLVDCDRLGYNEIDLRRGTAFAVTDPPTFDGVEQRFLELAEQHPLVPRQRSGDLQAYLLSDFLSERSFHRLELYHDVYRPLEVEDQLALGLPGQVIVAINLSRRTRSFTARDRAVLELVRPHLTHAYQQACEYDRVRMLMETVEAGLEEHHTGVVQVDPSGRIIHGTSGACELLALHDGVSGTPPRLPAQVRSWLQATADRACSHPRELLIDGPRGQLHLREPPQSGSAEWRVLIVEERRASPPSIDSLRTLGLTGRQAQVLRLLACGKRNRQIAVELQISTGTVEKHLEHIYERLGVCTRAQAVALSYGAAGGQTAPSSR